MLTSLNTTKDRTPAFKSLANPVKPFKIKTSLGTLDVKEITYKNFKNDETAKDIIEFCYKNFASNTQDPAWLSYYNPEKKSFWEKFINRDSNTLAERIKSKDENLTVLVAKDKNKKIQGACFSYGMEDIPFTEKDVCYIDSLAVNPEYRGQKVGKILLDKTSESAQNVFTDMFLTGDKMAQGFYDKLGFKELDDKNPNQKIIIDKFDKIRKDYPDYISLLNKPLQPTKPRWYDNPIHKDFLQ